MLTKKIAAAMIAGGLAVTACAAFAADDPPITTKSGTLGQPPAGMGQVVFFRPGSMWGMAMGCTVHEDDKELARLGSGKYYVITATPGKHMYFTEGMRTDRLNLEVEDGETYFVRCNIGMGMVGPASANLSPSDRGAFASKAKGLKMWAGKDDKDDKGDGDKK